MESTYGDRNHPVHEDVEDLLAEIINDTRKRGGNVVIPAFSIERSQELMLHLHSLITKKRIPRMMVFLDSPMAIRVTEVFKRHREYFDDEMNQLLDDNRSPFDFRGLKMSRSTEESKAINEIKGSCIIIAGSGMCTGGRIKHHLINNANRSESTLLFVGYQAVGTLGRRIIDGANPVRIHGELREIRAKIEQIYGFSGHGDRNDLFRWLSGLNGSPKHVFLTHGELDAANALKKYIEGKTDLKVTVPEYRSRAEL